MLSNDISNARPPLAQGFLIMLGESGSSSISEFENVTCFVGTDGALFLVEDGEPLLV